MFTPAPSEHELAAAGMTWEDVECDAVELWPENAAAFNLFSSLRTQWRVGMAGATGLDFMVAYARMDRMNLTRAEYDQLDQDLQVMEAAALATMIEQAEERAARDR